MPAASHPHDDVRDVSLSGARAWFSRKGLSRPSEGRVLAGVCASFARRYDLNLLVARLLAIVSVLVFTPLVYVGAWILMPSDAVVAPPAA